ncbi:unnamed protein product [Arctogadus glacialis]
MTEANTLQHAARADPPSPGHRSFRLPVQQQIATPPRAVRGCPAVTVTFTPPDTSPLAVRRSTAPPGDAEAPPMPTVVAVDSLTLHTVQRIHYTHGNPPVRRAGSDGAPRRLTPGRGP